MLVFQAEGEVEDRLSLVGVRVALLPYLYGTAQIPFCLLEPSAAQIPQSGLVQTAHVVGVAAQRLLVVVQGRPCGVAVLLQVQSRQVQLVVGLGVHRRQRSFGGIGNRTNLVGLGLPGQQRHSLRTLGLCLADGKREFRKLCLFHVDALRQHFFGTHGQRFFVIRLVLQFVAQHQLHVLPAGGHQLQRHLAVAGVLDVEDEVAAGLLHDAYFAIGHEILHKLLLFVRHQPSEVGLVFGIYPRHQFNIGAETRADFQLSIINYFISKIPVPCPS